MKPAEEWSQEVSNADMTSFRSMKNAEQDNIALIKEIQLDAYKAGMTEAAEILVPSKTIRAGISSVLINKKLAILTARDNKTSL